ncbi:hypothetical protein [Undibacterium sp. TJN19]|uniref:hypothetical protein n=1 Tax=Undibacterium sp. TJN19 TaxID=3413055 RepID=UPI003BF1000A
MLADDHIKRLQADPDGLDFDGFRRQGVELLQALSGHQWTDYNLHDPGVTLLELLCYGLTDLAYRSGFSVADYLTLESGNIDFERQALYRPQDILPVRPVTAVDYCKLIYDSIPEIDDIWLQASANSGQVEGLFSIYVKLHQPLSEIELRSEAEVRQDIIAIYAQNRNICQDLDCVYIVKTEPHYLSGEIEIDESRPAPEIYADIYFQCAMLISSGAHITRFEEALEKGMSWEELLNGPLTSHGQIDDQYFTRTTSNIDVVSLIALIRRIPGVKQVHRFQLLDQNLNKCDHLNFDLRTKSCPVLCFPSEVAQMNLLRLVYDHATDRQTSGYKPAEKRLILPQEAALLEQVRLILKKYEFSHHAFRRHDANLDELIKLPKGEYRPFQEYSTVSEHAPAIYGINHYGIPGSEPPDVHARARQLKGFLFSFEQLMANYLQSLQAIPDLYSLDAPLRKTYFSQFLGTKEIPGLDNLYTDTASADISARILLNFDQFGDRRNRVLDTLLAMYGESFPADALRRFNTYFPEEDEQLIIDSKINYLKNLRELSANRGAAINLFKPYWAGENFASLQHKILLLTGCNTSGPGRSLTGHFSTQSPAFVSKKTYLNKLGKVPDEVENKRNVIPLSLQKETIATPLKRLPHDMVCAELLSAGIDMGRYRLVPRPDKKLWLCLEDETGDALWHLIPLPEEQAVNYAHGMRQRLIELSQQAEGMHVLEHLLLRPYSNKTDRELDPIFYAHRVSIILPGFTARFADPACRAWIEELIAQNLPAHILPEIHWLDYVYLNQFEKRYKKWLELLSRYDRSRENATSVDEAADALITLLQIVRQHSSPRHWL